jgi:alpha-galactosidase
VIDEGACRTGTACATRCSIAFGYFVTESSEHFSEYVPWFIKRDRPDLIEQFNIPLDEYIRRCEVQITGWEFMRQQARDSPQPT